MTDISPEAEAAREAARVQGRFGEQAHTAPETELLADEPTDDVIYERLSWVHSKDSYAADIRREELRLASFVADARRHVPGATSAVFYWDFDGGDSRITFGHYTNADGEVLDQGDEYPDVNDFAFTDYKEAAQYGFVEDHSTGAVTIDFDEVPLPDADRARAELAVGEKLEREKDSQAIRYFLSRAMDEHLDPEKVANLSDEQLVDIRRALAQTTDIIRMAMNAPR